MSHRRNPFHRMLRLLSQAASLILIAMPALAATPTLTVQGRILKPDGTVFNNPSVDFKIRIVTPTDGCILYEETQAAKDLSASNGLFAITLNDGSGTTNAPTTYSLRQALSNGSSFGVNSSYCGSGSGTVSWTPSDTSERKVIVYFKDHSSPTWEVMPTAHLSHTAYAVEASQVAGFTANNLVRVADSGVPQSIAALTSANFTELQALIGGTSTQYTKASATAGLGIPVVSGAPSTPVQGSMWYDSATNSVKFYTGSTARSVITANQFDTSGGCSASKTLTYNSVTDTFTCASIGIAASQITSGTIDASVLPTSATFWADGGGGNISYSGGNVGIGTATPASPLQVDQTSTATTTGQFNGIEINYTVSPTANQASGANRTSIATNTSISASNTRSVDTVAGVNGYAENLGTGAVNKINGVLGYAYNGAAAAVSTLYGGYFGAQSDAGTVGELVGYYADGYVNGGTVSSVIGVKINSANSGGTVTSRYGIYLTPPTGAATNDYGIYQQGTQKNYFAGKIGIGTTSPSTPLHLSGTQPQITFADSALASNPTFGLTNTINSAGTFNFGFPLAEGTNRSVNFRMNGANVMTVFGTGRVGIGTVTPATALDVNGTVTATTFSGAMASSSNATSGAYTINTNSDASGTDGGLNFQVNGTTKVAIDNAGNLGIGTTTPSYPLSLSGASAQTIGMERTTGTGGLALTLQAGGGKSGGTDMNGGTLNLSGGTSTGCGGSSINFNVATGGACGTSTDSVPVTKMTLTSAGRLGIGTQSPSGIIGVTGQAAQKFTLERNTTANTAGNDLTLASGGATSAATDKNGGDLLLQSGIATGTGSSKIQFLTATPQSSTNTTDNTPTAKMTITGNGWVGIGTTTPSSFLHITETSTSTSSYNSMTQTANMNPASASTALYRGILQNANWMSSSNLNSGGGLVGGEYAAGHSSNATVVGATGLVGNAVNYWHGTITTATGISGVANNISTGTIGTANGGTFNVTNGGGGTVNTGIGVYIGGIAATTKYSLYASDATAPSYFAGSVGVGTTAPAVALGVIGPSDTSGIQIRRSSASTGATAVLGFRNATSESATNSSQIQSIRTNSPSSSDTALAFSVTGATTLTERMRIDSNGNVGIGTSTPASMLSVTGAQGSNALLSLTNSSATGHTFMTFQGTGYAYGVGVGNASESLFGVANKWFVYDGSVGAMRMVVDSSGNVGIGNTAPAYKLDVTGDVSASGCLRASGATASGVCSSDERLKSEIRPFSLGLDALMGIQPKTFKYNGLGGHPASDKPELGVIAQDVETTAPELVVTKEVKMHAGDREPTSIKQVNYTAFTYVLINSVKELYHRWFDDSRELHREIDELKAREAAHAQEMQEMKARLEQLERQLRSR